MAEEQTSMILKSGAEPTLPPCIIFHGLHSLCQVLSLTTYEDLDV